jgi:Leucine-rich repeat (LRR) protein
MQTNDVLNLWKKNLGAVPDEVWEHAGVTALILADNGLTEISERIGELQWLRTLDLGHNLLAGLPTAMGRLTGLSDFLYLHDNRLESLPPSMEELQRLRYLNISENRFAVFPESICSMSRLVELRATDNQIYLLPDSIGKLSRLRELHLRNNRLTGLPPAISQLSELRLIDLRGNPIDELPDSILELPKLEKLDLRWVNTLRPPEWIDALAERGCLVYR